MNTKREQLDAGIAMMEKWCAANMYKIPEVQIVPSSNWGVQFCAYYRKDVIKICLEKCGHIGYAGPAWSYPGWLADRTPYGVIAHELGHHVDLYNGMVHRGPYYSEFSTLIRAKSGEIPITSYCPNDAEWFAEMFRVFITNPDLLRQVRPQTWALMFAHFCPVETRGWAHVLADAPARTLALAQRRVSEAI